MIKKLKHIEVEEKFKSFDLAVFTLQEFKDIFAVSQNTASVAKLFGRPNMIKLIDSIYVEYKKPAKIY
jgi:hypothetical protein